MAHTDATSVRMREEDYDAANAVLEGKRSEILGPGRVVFADVLAAWRHLWQNSPKKARDDAWRRVKAPPLGRPPRNMRPAQSAA